MNIVSFNEAVRVITSGQLLVYPTETFYALGCDAFVPDAIELIYKVKQRNASSALPVIVPDILKVGRLARTVSEVEEQLMQVFWPGPLTILFDAHPDLPAVLLAGTGQVAVRLSSHPFAVMLAKKADTALVCSSANISGVPPVAKFNLLSPHITTAVSGVTVEGPSPAGGKPSTIVRVENKNILVLREGVIAKDDLLAQGFSVR